MDTETMNLANEWMRSHLTLVNSKITREFLTYTYPGEFIIAQEIKEQVAKRFENYIFINNYYIQTLDNKIAINKENNLIFIIKYETYNNRQDGQDGEIKIEFNYELKELFEIKNKSDNYFIIKIKDSNEVSGDYTINKILQYLNEHNIQQIANN